MLIKFTVDNFMSLGKETELVMIPSNKIKKKAEHKIKISKTSLLKHAVIYGPNASGKSNLISALGFFQFSVTKSIPVESKNLFCKTLKENENKISNFEIQFTINNKFYAYGFSALLKESKLTQEWLYELDEKVNNKTIFTREENNKPIFGDSIQFNELDKLKMDTYLSDFDEKSNMLFLTFMNLNKNYTQDSKLIIFKDVYSWIKNNIDIYRPQTSLNNFEYYYDNASLDKINTIIKTFDTGITKVGIVEITFDELKTELPPPVYIDLMEFINEKLETEKIVKVSMRANKSFFNIEAINGGERKITTIKLNHGSSCFDFAFKEESDGTRRLFELIDILLNKTESKVYIIDELERSLHPKLTAKFIELFETLHEGQKIQLLFTTHEATIMDQELFRRDEIWFLERDIDNNSNLYSLDKFKERYDKKLSKAYLEGRYGAIPIFTSFNLIKE